MAEVAGSNPAEPIFKINDGVIREHLDILRLKGVTEKHIKEVNRTLKRYQKYILSTIDKQKSIQFFKKLQHECSVSYYRKQMYQILRFLAYLKIDWTNDIVLPKEPMYMAQRFTRDDINDTLNYFKDNEQMKAVTLLCSSSGIRAHELYQLTYGDLNLNKRKIIIRHEPENKKTTKTKKSRVAFFDEKAQAQLKKYFETKPVKLFAQKTCTRAFKNSPVKIKEMRKFFSQEWDRQGGPTSIKKILMGHSPRGDVDMQFYNNQTSDDLKKIYDKIMRNL